MESKEAEESAGDGAERDLGVRDGEAAGGLAGSDVSQGAGCESAGGVEEVEAGAGDEGGDFGVGPGEAAGDAQRGGEHLGWVVETGARGVDHLRPALENLLRRGLEEFFLADEVVVEGPEADVGGFGDLLDAGPFSAAFGDEPDGGVDECLAGAGLPAIEPVGADRSVRCRRVHCALLRERIDHY